ncbi:MAG: hypothetical protein R6X02_10915 [Enhygromyxa sp.]
MPDDSNPKKTINSEEQERVLTRILDTQFAAAKHVFASAARSTAMRTELRSGQGMVIGAVVGCVLGGLLIAWTNVLSAPLALLLVAACSGLGWMRARYQGALAALPETARTAAEAHLQILFIQLRAIAECDLSKQNAEAARAAALARFNESLAKLNLPGLPQNLALEPLEALEPKENPHDPG